MLNNENQAEEENTENKCDIEQTRRRRKIKNGLVNVDDVTICPGPEYENWILLSKTKLKEREMKLIKTRLQLIQNTIVSSFSQFTSENTTAFYPNNQSQLHIDINGMETENYEAYYNVVQKTNLDIINKFNESMQKRLAGWKGYKPKDNIITKNKRSCTFRDYFKGSRGWWDIHKIDIIATNIIIPISHMIYTFTKGAASKFFANRFFRLQKLYQTYLYAVIFINLVERRMKLPNTRELLVFPSQCYSMVEMKHFKDCTILTVADQKVKSKQFKHIRNHILNALKQEYNNSKLKFQSKLFSLHYEVDVMMQNNENSSYKNQK